MANYISDDRGNMTLAVGADGSIARLRVQYPALIERLQAMPHMHRLAFIQHNGFKSQLVIGNLLLIADGKVPYSATNDLLNMATAKVEELISERESLKQQVQDLQAALREYQTMEVS